MIPSRVKRELEDNLLHWMLTQSINSLASDTGQGKESSCPQDDCFKCGGNRFQSPVQTSELGHIVHFVHQIFLVARREGCPSFELCLEFQQRATPTRNGRALTVVQHILSVFMPSNTTPVIIPFIQTPAVVPFVRTPFVLNPRRVSGINLTHLH